MRKSKLYKHFNLLFQVVIAVVAIYIIYIKLKDELRVFNTHNIAIDYKYMLYAFLLLFINWGLEALKWKLAIKRTLKLTFRNAFKYTFTSVTASLITPNRIGEIPFRALMLGKNYFKEATLKTMVSSYCQLIITLVLGTTSILFIPKIIPENYQIVLFVSLLICSALLLLILFKIDRLVLIVKKIKFLKKYNLFEALSDFDSKEIFILLLLSLIRYFVFSFQFYLVFRAFGLNMSAFNELMLIPFFFLVTTVIPTILISELGVRSSVAIYIFGYLADYNTTIILVSVTLWLLNVAFPALFGVFNLKQLKILKAE